MNQMQRSPNVRRWDDHDKFVLLTCLRHGVFRCRSYTAKEDDDNDIIDQSWDRWVEGPVDDSTPLFSLSESGEKHHC